MEMQFTEAIEKAIHQLVAEFQGNPRRFFNERDLHWSLYHYLRQQDIFQGQEATDLIRAEFPTRKVYEGRRPARGHFDLVVLEPNLLADPRVANMAPWDPWKPFLELVEVLIAVEVKMWVERSSDKQMNEKIDWDIKKLTDEENAVKHAYLLNFVQLDFSRPIMKRFYLNLCEHLKLQAKQGPKILCVPSDITMQPASESWVSP
jgi:hypothetical protein